MKREGSPEIGAGAAPADREARRTIVAAGSRVEGKITGTAELAIEGELVGDVALETVVMIGGSGHVRGSVVARAVRVSGRVEGNVTASERIEVLSTGVVDGDLSAPKIAVAEGAEIRGRVEMRAKAATSAKATPSAGAKA